MTKEFLPSSASLITECHEDILDFRREEWNQIVNETGSPVFYSYDFLRAYQVSGLPGALGHQYFMWRDEQTREPLAVLPAYLQPLPDSLGTVKKILPMDNRNGVRKGFLTHGWHFYDTTVPSLIHSPVLLQKICDELARVAARYGADCVGFVNVPAKSWILSHLQSLGFSCSLIDTRFVLNLSPFGGFDEYFASLSANMRKNHRRYRRRANQIPVVSSVAYTNPDDIDQVVALCGLTAEKHGNPSFYSATELSHFVRELGPSACLIKLQRDEVLIAASICFLDEDRLHTWAGGVDYLRRYDFSPNYLLFEEEVKAAFRLHKRILEGGRRSTDFKLRHGMEAMVLYGCLAQA